MLFSAAFSVLLVCKQIIHHIGGGSLCGLDGMGINLCGGACVCVAKLSGNGGDRNTVCYIQGCIRVAKTVQVDLRKVCALNEVMKPSRKSVRVHGGAVKGGEYFVAVFPQTAKR